MRLHRLSLYAEHSLDTGPCQRIIAGNSETQLWQDSCVSGVAMARRDPALCDQVSISEIRDSCYMMLVVQFGSNSGICERIENPTLKNTCSE